MFEVDAKVTISPDFLKALSKAQTEALSKAAEAVRGDLIIAQTMPFRDGILQNDSTFIDEDKLAEGEAALVSSTPYARRLYYNPQYNFSTLINPNAGGRWLDPYLKGGERENVFRDAYRKFFKEGLGKWLK